MQNGLGLKNSRKFIHCLFQKVLYHLFERVYLLCRYLGRLIDLPASYRRIRTRGSSKYSDPWADIVPYIRGRVVFDMLPVMRQMFPEEASFKLAYISRRFLGCCKGDVHYSEIFELQMMNATSRKRLADYCLQDSWLVAELLLRKPMGDESSKASFIQHYCEKARSSGSPLRYAVSKSNRYNTYFKTVRKVSAKTN